MFGLIPLNPQDVLQIFQLLGGLALFLFGMQTMSAGLTQMAGSGMRRLVNRATRNRLSGLSLGTGLGFMVQSSAATVMLVGFVNAGLMTLPQSIPLVIGANIGTSLSMQMISFKLSDYCFVAIGLGFLVSAFGKGNKTKGFGRAFLGFGLLFLGMSTMSAAVLPYRETLAPWLAKVDGTQWTGALLGVALAAGITAVIQSSGATIGMVFAMIHAGVITSLPSAFPLVIGAGIGTCVTALLGSIGAGIQARRTALSHLGFNLYSVALSMALSPFIYRWMPTIPGDLVHQTANANMIRMLFTGLLLLPVVGLYGKLIVLLSPSQEEVAEGSYLDEGLLSRPEEAIRACIHELKRVAGICEKNLILSAALFRSLDRKTLLKITNNETAINEIKTAMEDYEYRIADFHLSKRQSLMLQYLNRCMSNLERIGDHVDRMREITVARLSGKPVLFDEALLAEWFLLYGAGLKVMRLVRKSMDPDLKRFQQNAQLILDARNAYIKQSLSFRSLYHEKSVAKGDGLSPAAGIYLTKYVDALDRIVTHAKTIAMLQGRPEFFIKRKKLTRKVGAARTYAEPEWVDVSEYLQRLESEPDL
jgi:phosphate:Na+ symporter